jgi:Flp pilus assembly protein TadD
MALPTVSILFLCLLADGSGGAASLLEKGERLFRQGDTAGAIAAFDEAAKVDPKDARAPYLKGVALEK